MSARDPTIAARSKRYRDRKRSGATSTGRSAAARPRSTATTTGDPPQNSGKTADENPVPATRATSVASPSSERTATATVPADATVGAVAVETIGPVARPPWTLGAAILIILALLIGALALAINAQAG